MLYNFQRNKLSRHLLVGGALFAAGLGMFSCSDTYDLDSTQPTGAGGEPINSLYGYIKDLGNCKNYLQLINDMGMDTILSKTGSMTMFVADDDAFAEFYKSNKWGVHSYDELSAAQKKLLLNSSMIGNPLTTTMLSNATATGEGAPTRGEVCRRMTQLDIADSVPVVKAEDNILPNNEFLTEFKKAHTGQDIVLFSDSIDPAPMMHFTAKYILANKIEYSDIDFVMNDPDKTLSTNPSEFLVVNGARVKNIDDDANIFCKNGFIHKVDQVIMPLDNMAEIIRNDQNSSTYSDILERFASITYSRQLTDRYNNLYGTSYDSVYIKKYFSTRAAGSSATSDNPFKYDMNGKTCTGTLKFDPGWNSYVSSVYNDRVAMMEDFAVMLVPSNEAMNTWWNEGGGKVIKDFYGTLENTPLSTLEKLVNVNMIESFNSAVPSRFNSVLNDANERLGITENDITHVTMGCNGVIYHTNKVFAPASYSSVLFPAIVDTAQFNILNLAIHQLDYDKYLNSMVSKYSFFLPTNDGIADFVDPVSYALGNGQGYIWNFLYDQKKKNIHAEIYNATLVDGKWIKGESTGKYVAGKPGSAIGCKGQVVNTSGDAKLTDRMEELLDNCIVIEPLAAGKKYYKTKGNTFVHVEANVDPQGNMTEADMKEMMVFGAEQDDASNPISVSQIYNMENGKTYICDAAIAGAHKNVAMTLAEIPEFSEFYNILFLSGALNQKNSKDGWMSAAKDDNTGNLLVIKQYGSIGAEDIPTGKSEKDTKATYLLNNYHYTIYAPTNDAMQKAYDMGLPTPERIDQLEELLSQAKDENNSQAEDSIQLVIDKTREAMLDFVKYHIQDNSIFMDEGFDTGNYYSAKTELIQATDDEGKPSDKWTPGRPYKINVANVSGTNMTVIDNIGQSHNVIPTLSNIMCSEYWFDTRTTITAPESVNIANSSFVVIQGIDGPLVYDYNPNDLENHNQFEYKYRPIYQEK